MARRSGSELRAGGEVTDKLDLGEWAWGGGRECAKGGWCAGSAKDLAGEHLDGLLVIDWGW